MSDNMIIKTIDQEIPPDPKTNKARSIYTEMSLSYDSLKEYQIVQKPKIRHLKDKQERVKLYMSGIELLIKNINTSTGYKVALFMLKNLDWNGKVSISQREISQALGIKQPNISKALKEILSSNDNDPIFTKITDKKGVRSEYMVNENVSWKGWVDTKPSLKMEVALLH